MTVTSASEGLIPSNVSRSGTNRDRRRRMRIGLLHVFVLVAAFACRQEKRESSGEVAAKIPAHPAPVATPDSDVSEAQGELAEGRPWLATRRLGTALATPERRSPEAVLVAARAAAAWGGWQYVDQ